MNKNIEGTKTLSEGLLRQEPPSKARKACAGRGDGQGGGKSSKECFTVHSVSYFTYTWKLLDVYVQKHGYDISPCASYTQVHDVTAQSLSQNECLQLPLTLWIHQGEHDVEFQQPQAMTIGLVRAFTGPSVVRWHRRCRTEVLLIFSAGWP